MDAPPYDFELYWLDGDSDSEFESETDTAIPADCESALIPACGETAYLLPPIVEAADFGEGVRFVDVNPMAILAERENEDGVSMLVIARTNDTDLWSDAVDAEFALGEGRPVGLAGPYPFEYEHAALVCYPDLSCRLFGVSVPHDEPVEIWPLEDGFVPAEMEARGVAGGEGGWEGEVLAFGNGVALFYGGWTELFPQSPGSHFNAIAGMEYAVGDDGRLVTLGSNESAWSELESGTDTDLVSAAWSLHGIAIGAADGRLGWRDDLDDQTPYWMEIADKPIVSLDSEHHDDQLVGLTDDGCAFEAVPGALEDQPCVFGVLPDVGLSVLVWNCWDSRNVSYLGEHGLYGEWACYHYS